MMLRYTRLTAPVREGSEPNREGERTNKSGDKAGEVHKNFHQSDRPKSKL
jgi:hypothetical protein